MMAEISWIVEELTKYPPVIGKPAQRKDFLQHTLTKEDIDDTFALDVWYYVLATYWFLRDGGEVGHGLCS